jgi:cell division protein FtsN
MTDIINKLERANLFPYTIADENNGYRLYVGAFATKPGAENLNNQLRVIGINAVIEER